MNQETPKFRTRPVGVIRKSDWKLLLFYEEWILDEGREKIANNNSVERGHKLSINLFSFLYYVNFIFLRKNK